MDKTQATEIQKHLTAASNAINRALSVIRTLEKEDHAMFAGPLVEIDSCLHFKPREQKTAMVVVKALDRCIERALPVKSEVIAARLQALAESDDRIEHVGDLRMWRHSEVRLKS